MNDQIPPVTCPGCGHIVAERHLKVFADDGRTWHRRCYRLKAEPTGWKKPVDDSVDHPSHYTRHPSGIECITVTEHMGFCLGNAVKYIWRADLKGKAVEDLRKARWYIDREIEKRSNDE